MNTKKMRLAELTEKYRKRVEEMGLNRKVPPLEGMLATGPFPVPSTGGASRAAPTAFEAEKALSRTILMALLGGASGGMDAAERCSCGWELPLGVMPIRLNATTARALEGPTRQGDLPLEEHLIQDGFVVLLCPHCGDGHVMVHPAVAQKAGKLRGGQG